MRSVLLTCLALVAPLALADSHGADTETIQDYRHSTYEAIGGHMGAIVQIVRNGYRTGDLQHHADSIVGLSRIVPELFPEGSGGGETEALPVIWEEPEEFDQRMADFMEAAETMAAAASSDDMARIGGALQGLGDACKGCHDNFREEH